MMVLKILTYQEVQDYYIPSRSKEVNTRPVYLKTLKNKLGSVTCVRLYVLFRLTCYRNLPYMFIITGERLDLPPGNKRPTESRE